MALIIMSTKTSKPQVKGSEKVFYFSTPEKEENSQKVLPIIDVDLASYFQPWINFCYYILFVPFKVEFDGTMYYLRQNTVQKILCAILHPIICINACFEFHEKFVDKIRYNPEIFMRAIERFNSIFFCLFFYYAVWFKREYILNICNDSKPLQDTKKLKQKVTLCCASVVLFALSTFLFLFLEFERHNFDFKLRVKVQEIIQTIRFEYYLTRHLEIGQPSAPLTTFGLIGITVSLFLRFYKWVLMDFIVSLNVMTGFVSLKLAQKFKQVLIGSSQLGSKGDDVILEMYSKLTNTFNKLNDLIGPNYAVVFFFLITFTAVYTIDILDSDVYSLRFLRACFCVYLFLGLLFAAEAHYQASYFKTWLLLRYQNGGSLAHLTGYHLEVEQCNLAMKGGRCFTVTYSFLGTASSVVLTYVIIMIQFGGGRPD